MILILKRFDMDDVPFLLHKGTMKEAETFIKGRMSTMKSHRAGKKDQALAAADISSELHAFSLVEFDAKGVPVCSRIIPID